MRAGSTRAQAGAAVLACPCAEQLTLLVAAPAVPAPIRGMLLSLEPGNGMDPQGLEQKAAQQEPGKAR